MNAELLKRLIRAISEGVSSELEKVAQKVVEDERKRGHGRLAAQLEAMLRGKKKERRAGAVGGDDRQVRELPVSRRHRELLATLVPRSALEHHMVLPSHVEIRFQRIEREYAARERLGAFGLWPRKTILLHGPPGCGKSLGARRLAWNIGLPLLKVRFDALLSSFFGESASNLRAVFDAAKERPCVLLLDECDFIARSRANFSDVGEASRIVNSLLQLMEEYDAPGLLVATTNVQSSLDEALFRRFDDVFEIPLPGAEEVERLLRLSLTGLEVEADLPWSEFVAQLQGQAAAMVVKVARDAAKSTVLASRKVVGKEMIWQAIEELHKIE